MQIPCVYLPGPAPAVSVANSNAPTDFQISTGVYKQYFCNPFLQISERSLYAVFLLSFVNRREFTVFAVLLAVYLRYSHYLSDIPRSLPTHAVLQLSFRYTQESPHAALHCPSDIPWSSTRSTPTVLQISPGYTCSTPTILQISTGYKYSTPTLIQISPGFTCTTPTTLQISSVVHIQYSHYPLHRSSQIVGLHCSAINLLRGLSSESIYCPFEFILPVMC